MKSKHFTNFAAGLIMAAALGAPAKGGEKVAVSAAADLVAAENAHLRIEFSRKDGVIRLAKLVNRSDKRSVLEDAGPLWRAETDKGNVAGDAPAKAASLAAKELPGGGAQLTLRWEGAGAGALDVEVTVDVAPGSRETLWRIHPAAADKNAAIRKVHFPVLDGLGRGGKWDRLVRPHDANPRALNPEVLPESGLVYPTGGHAAISCHMQFVIYEFAAPGCTGRQAYEDQEQVGGGLYLAAYDPLCQQKVFSCKGLGEGKGTSLAVRHFGEGLVTDKDGKPGLGFPCAVGVFDGGYWGGLDLYRDWARGQAWCAAGPIRKRADFPKKLLNTHVYKATMVGMWPHDFKRFGENETKYKALWDDFWNAKIVFDQLPKDFQAAFKTIALERVKQELDVVYRDVPWKAGTLQLGVHWYCYNIYLFDHHNPDYLPLAPGWMETREQLDKAYPGVLTHMMYVNNNVCGPHSELGRTKSEEVAKFGLTKEFWHLTNFDAMCPDTPFWQDVMVDLARRMFQESKCDGYYMDQGGAGLRRCMKTDHGHQPGDPASFVRGRQTMYRKIRAAIKPINPDAYYTEEFFMEPHVGLIDGFLTSQDPDNSLVSYVYGESAVLIGHGAPWPEEYQPGGKNAGKPHYNVLGLWSWSRAFLSGAQLGWGSPGMNNGINTYYRNLARLRVKALPYLLLPMARPITFTTSLRKGDHGEAVVIATHPTYPAGLKANAEREGIPPRYHPNTLNETYELDCRAAGLQPGQYRLRVIRETEEKDLGPLEVTGATVKFPITLEPQESAIYVLEPLAAKGK